MDFRGVYPCGVWRGRCRSVGDVVVCYVLFESADDPQGWGAESEPMAATALKQWCSVCVLDLRGNSG